IPKAELARLFPANVVPAPAVNGDEVELKVHIRNSDAALHQFHEIFQEVNPRHDLIVLSITEAFMAWAKVCIMCGLVLGSPWIFMQIWAFIGAGLYPQEKRLINVYLPVSIVLFLGGVLLCYFVVLPRAVQALLWFNQWTGLDPELRFSDWLSFAIMLPAFMGICFQLPLVMYALERFGIFTVEAYVAKWRIATFIIFVIALLPTMDMFTPFLIAVPMVGLYWLGILLCKFNRKPDEDDLDVNEPEGDLIEV
ncbi:MAG TPA: twin-arginine translocase subunit TatC, partial [Gemmataceae bacterium]|nr:twin-arginine translocase subunit TatC [Gemmataceae bacterium]